MRSSRVGVTRAVMKGMYTDPGSGLFLFQIVLAGALTAVYRFRRALSSFFVRRGASDRRVGN